ncbi:MAG: ribose 5-phosphate isomerase B [Chloroflexi bacterium]|nr:ribose 5-phosphate isomerase B [Chloroflexota bacterium]
MRIVVASDHVGFLLKPMVLDELRRLGHTAVDLGPESPQSVDFPDYAALVGKALQNSEADRGILICGSGVGMCIAANKLHGIRACVTHDTYSAGQGVEHDDMNVMCLGGRVIGEEVARSLVRAFMHAQFQPEERFVRRLNKVKALENG